MKRCHQKDGKRHQREKGCRRKDCLFYLQQVIVLPRNNGGELLDKSLQSCYNITVYDVKKHLANCFLWNESTASKSGANEISYHLSKYHFLADLEKYQKNYFFDGCSG